MPGLSTGLSAKLINYSDLSTTDNDIFNVIKFQNVHTFTDWFVVPTSALTGTVNTGAQFSRMNGKTTGNQTLYTQSATHAIGGLTTSTSWVAFTAKTNGTNVTFSANHWLRIRYDEVLTVNLGIWTACYWAVEGNV